MQRGLGQRQRGDQEDQHLKSRHYKTHWRLIKTIQESKTQVKKSHEKKREEIYNLAQQMAPDVSGDTLDITQDWYYGWTID
jgi:hypothetical protein